MQDAVKALALQYFKGLFQVAQPRKVGAPSKERLERERAVEILSKEFCDGYFETNETVRRDVAEGKDNRALLTGPLFITLCYEPLFITLCYRLRTLQASNWKHGPWWAVCSQSKRFLLANTWYNVGKQKWIAVPW